MWALEYLLARGTATGSVTPPRHACRANARLNVILLAFGVNAAARGFRAERKKKICPGFYFPDHDHDVLEACEPASQIPFRADNANVHASSSSRRARYCLTRVRLKLPTWGYQVRKILDGGRKMWSGTLDRIASGRPHQIDQRPGGGGPF